MDSKHVPGLDNKLPAKLRGCTKAQHHHLIILKTTGR